jgi:hypothetical protein
MVHPSVAFPEPTSFLVRGGPRARATFSQSAGRTPAHESGRIRGHGIPEAIEAILIGRSRLKGRARQLEEEWKRERFIRLGGQRRQRQRQVG